MLIKSSIVTMMKYTIYCNLLFFIMAILCESRSNKNRKVVLITGCSSGIGKSAAEEFMRHPNFKVWATMREIKNSPFPATTADERLAIASMDVTSTESVNNVIRHIIEVDGKIDIVINNAGQGMAGCLETVHLEEAQQLFDVNVWGVMRLLQAVLPHMRKRRFGHIINISSTSGIRGIPCMEIYTGSKFAIEGMMDSLRYSASAFNISITNVNAGPISTNFVEKMKIPGVGRGSRDLSNYDESFDYLQIITGGMVAGLEHRMKSPDAQSSEEFAHVLVNLVNLKLAAKRVTDVPFNIGSNRDSQSLLEQVKKIPTGWGGLYNDILKVIPPVRETLESIASHSEEL